MTTNFRRNKDHAGRRRLSALVLLSVLCLLIVFVPPVRNASSSVAFFFARPVWLAVEGAKDSARNISAYFVSKSALQRENTRLLHALYATANERRMTELLQRENAELKSMLGRNRDIAGRSFALATVLVRPPTTAFDTFIIDLGETDGAAVGMRVFSDGAFAIGEIVETYARSSLVALYSSSGYELDGFVGASSTPATFHGVGGGAFRASVPKGAGVGVSDPIVLPSIHPTLAGVVSGIDVFEGSSLVTVHVTLPVNLASLRFVYVEIFQ